MISTAPALSAGDRVNTSPNVLMIFPKFNANSYWSMQAVCDIEGRKCLAPPLGLITLAALLPAAWNIRLINRNAEDLSDADIGWADLVMTGGMMPQRRSRSARPAASRWRSAGPTRCRARTCSPMRISACSAKPRV
jgi:hypothetical protein